MATNEHTKPRTEAEIQAWIEKLNNKGKAAKAAPTAVPDIPAKTEPPQQANNAIEKPDTKPTPVKHSRVSKPEPSISDNRTLDLIEAALEIEKLDAREAGELGFMPRILVQTTLPYRDPKTKIYERQNGNFKLSLLSPNGVPFGSIPRFFVSYIATEVNRTRSPLVSLGQNKSNFAELLGMKTAGGDQKKRIEIQFKKFFTSIFTMESVLPDKNGMIQESIENVLITKRAFLCWQPKKNEKNLWEATMEITSEFFQDCITKPIPIDLRVMDALSSSPMAMDIYVWLPYRVHTARYISVIPWPRLMMQFGSAEGTENRTFQRHFLRALKQVETVTNWHPSISIDKRDGLTIYPGRGHVACG